MPAKSGVDSISKYIRLQYSFGVVAGLFLITIGFQNCGKAGFDSTSQDPSVQRATPSDGAPFAFEASADMITYNSCASASSQGKTFTLKIGSYDSKSSASTDTKSISTVAKSGVRIHPDFINYAYDKLKPDYPNTEITSEQVQKLLAESPINNNVVPNFSVRSINKGGRLQNIFAKANPPVVGLDIILGLGNLANATWANTLLSNSFPRRTQIEWANFFENAQSTKSRMEAAFSFNDDTQRAENIRNAFNKVGEVDAQLVLGFSYDSQGTLISTEAPDVDIMSKAYARGYQMGFTVPTVSASPSSWVYHPNNVVSNVVEYNLENNQKFTEQTWDCNLKFYVVRQEDAFFEWATVEQTIDAAVTTDANIPTDVAANPTFNKNTEKVRIKNAAYAYYGHAAGDVTGGFCPKMSYNKLRQVPANHPIYSQGPYAGKTYAEILEMVRRHLPSADWDVNLEKGCIVPNKFSCYPDDSLGSTNGGTYYGKYPIANIVNKECVHPFASTYVKAGKAGSSVLDWCNEFVTVCLKR